METTTSMLYGSIILVSFAGIAWSSVLIWSFIKKYQKQKKIKKTDLIHTLSKLSVAGFLTGSVSLIPELDTGLIQSIINTWLCMTGFSIFWIFGFFLVLLKAYVEIKQGKEL